MVNEYIWYMTMQVPSAVTEQEWKWPLQRYEQLVRDNIFTEEDKIELIGGKLYTQMPKGDLHAAIVRILTRYFLLRHPEYEVSAEQPIRLPGNDSRPEPDLAICNFRADAYATQAPEPADIRLVIEVADSSLTRDRTLKAIDYAAAAIQEYWIIDVKNQQVEIYTDPAGNRYRHVHTYPLDSTFTSPFNGETVVHELFPK